MVQTGTELHLILSTSEPAAASRPRVLETLRVPAGVSYLRQDAPLDNLLGKKPGNAALVVEPLAGNAEPRLLLLAPSGAPPATVNGRRAPRVSLLRPGDQLLLDDGRLLVLTAFDTPRIGPAADARPGATCPVCRTPFTEENARVFTCSCGTTLHYDTEDVPEDRRLQCAALATECATCRAPVHLQGGFRDVYIPDAC